MPPFLAHREHFASVGSTIDVVRDWLAAGRRLSGSPGLAVELA